MGMTAHEYHIIYNSLKIMAQKLIDFAQGEGIGTNNDLNNIANLKSKLSDPSVIFLSSSAPAATIKQACRDLAVEILDVLKGKDMFNGAEENKQLKPEAKALAIEFFSNPYVFEVLLEQHISTRESDLDPKVRDAINFYRKHLTEADHNTVFKDYLILRFETMKHNLVYTDGKSITIPAEISRFIADNSNSPHIIIPQLIAFNPVRTKLSTKGAEEDKYARIHDEVASILLTAARRNPNAFTVKDVCELAKVVRSRGIAQDKEKNREYHLSTVLDEVINNHKLFITSPEQQKAVAEEKVHATRDVIYFIVLKSIFDHLKIIKDGSLPNPFEHGSKIFNFADPEALRSATIRNNQYNLIIDIAQADSLQQVSDLVIKAKQAILEVQKKLPLHKFSLYKQITAYVDIFLDQYLSKIAKLMSAPAAQSTSSSSSAGPLGMYSHRNDNAKNIVVAPAQDVKQKR